MKKEIITISLAGLAVIGVIFLETGRSIRESPVTDPSAMTEGRYPGISSKRLQERMQRGSGLVIIDLRTSGEYNKEHITGAVNIPIANIEGHIDSLNREEETVLYCKSGPWSRQAYKILHEKGFNNLKVLENGIVGWKWEVNGEVVAASEKS